MPSFELSLSLLGTSRKITSEPNSNLVLLENKIESNQELKESFSLR